MRILVRYPYSSINGLRLRKCFSIDLGKLALHSGTARQLRSMVLYIRFYESGTFETWDYQTLDMCVNAYVFGDRFLVPAFCHEANSLFAATMVEKSPYRNNERRQSIVYAFETLPSNRIILQLMVDDYCKYWEDEDTENYGGEAMSKFPPAFLRRMSKGFLELDRKNLEFRISKKRCYEEYESKFRKEFLRAVTEKLHLRWGGEKQLGYFE